jgi:Tfp pilus assembly protein FimT
MYGLRSRTETGLGRAGTSTRHVRYTEVAVADRIAFSPYWADGVAIALTHNRVGDDLRFLISRRIRLALSLLSLRMVGRDRRDGCRGTTLLEVLTATAIMITLLGIGVPQLARLRAPYALASASRQIASDLQTARMHAIARNTRYRVAFNASAKTYVLEREAAPNNFVAEGGTQTLPAAATLTSASPANPIFDTRGLLAADVSVSVSVPGSGTKTVTINVLGRTTIS